MYTVARGVWAPDGEWGNVTPEIASGNDRSTYKVFYDVENLGQ